MIEPSQQKEKENRELEIALFSCFKRSKEGQKYIYELYYKKMYVVCLRYTSSADEAKDLLHDGFIKLFDKLASKPQIQNFDAWIHRLFTNFCLDFVRSAYKKYIVYYGDEQEVNLPDEAEQETHFEFPDHVQKDKLLLAMSKLRPDYRVVLNLYAIENYNHQQIAETLGIKEASSRSKLMRARNSLKKLLLDNGKK